VSDIVSKGWVGSIWSTRIVVVTKKIVQIRWLGKSIMRIRYVDERVRAKKPNMSRLLITRIVIERGESVSESRCEILKIEIIKHKV
jgi:hypothetical protein